MTVLKSLIDCLEHFVGWGHLLRVSPVIPTTAFQDCLKPPFIVSELSSAVGRGVMFVQNSGLDCGPHNRVSILDVLVPP